MNRTVSAWMISTSMTIAIAMTAAPAWAQHGRGGGKPSGTPHVAPAPKPATPHGSQAPKGTSGSHAPKGGSHAPKTTTSHGNSANAHSTKTTTARPSPTPRTSSPSTASIPSGLASKLQSRLPAGTNLDAAAAGFRNLGQFVAAVNVSNNLGIPFSELKTRMVDRGMSLGQAIQDARPKTADTDVVVRRAERDADDLIRQSETAKPKKTRK